MYFLIDHSVDGYDDKLQWNKTDDCNNIDLANVSKWTKINQIDNILR
jgi:hypothetical protein